ncbi:hypothetical protein BV25DRAFT_1825147 [Artomyces pyxidatus]|uniref:Uncharacterized protein n=1 Tax=Artomyces pyxidatus TaxID=48021 RepID=A0ACB8T2C9_9AGAM|nr:hypothetical protein BV25DRAFT_1825147 [Artomyces pyxidatus]
MSPSTRVHPTLRCVHRAHSHRDLAAREPQRSEAVHVYDAVLRLAQDDATRWAAFEAYERTTRRLHAQGEAEYARAVFKELQRGREQRLERARAGRQTRRTEEGVRRREETVPWIAVAGRQMDEAAHRRRVARLLGGAQTQAREEAERTLAGLWRK